MIEGKTKLIAHLGYPTESFKAPMIYNPYFAKHRINAVVVPMGCKPEDFPEFFKLLFRLSNIHGALITMPHKVLTVALLDEVSVSVKVAGALAKLLLTSDRGQFCLWSVEEKRLLAVYGREGPKKEIEEAQSNANGPERGACFSPDGTKVAWGCEVYEWGTVRVFDVAGVLKACGGK